MSGQINEINSSEVTKTVIETTVPVRPVWVSGELHARVRRVSQELGISMKQLAETAIERWMEEVGK